MLLHALAVFGCNDDRLQQHRGSATLTAASHAHDVRRTSASSGCFAVRVRFGALNLRLFGGALLRRPTLVCPATTPRVFRRCRQSDFPLLCRRFVYSAWGTPLPYATRRSTRPHIKGATAVEATNPLSG